jgi:hypothetical protein
VCVSPADNNNRILTSLIDKDKGLPSYCVFLDGPAQLDPALTHLLLQSMLFLVITHLPKKERVTLQPSGCHSLISTFSAIRK